MLGLMVHAACAGSWRGVAFTAADECARPEASLLPLSGCEALRQCCPQQTPSPLLRCAAHRPAAASGQAFAEPCNPAVHTAATAGGLPMRVFASWVHIACTPPRRRVCPGPSRSCPSLSLRPLQAEGQHVSPGAPGSAAQFMQQVQQAQQAQRPQQVGRACVFLQVGVGDEEGALVGWGWVAGGLGILIAAQPGALCQADAVTTAPAICGRRGATLLLLATFAGPGCSPGGGSTVESEAQRSTTGAG